MICNFINPRDGLQPYPQKPPLQALTMMSFTEQRGHAVGILDMNAMRGEFPHPQAFKHEISNDEPDAGWRSMDVAAVSCNAGQYTEAKEALQLIRKYRPDALRVIFGGIPSALLGDSLKLLAADVAIIGEPEDTWIYLLDYVDSRRFSDVIGIAYREAGGIKVGKPRRQIKDIDTLPLPAYKLLEGKALNYYFAHSQMHTPYQGVLRSFPVETQRGQLWNYGFTEGMSRWDMVEAWGLDAVKKLDGEKQYQEPARFHSPKHILENVHYLRDRYMVDFIHFTGLNFMSCRESVEKFCAEYMESGLHDCLHWSCVGDVENADALLLRKMKDAGCVFIGWNTQSNSPKTLKRVRKNSDPYLNQQAVDASTKAGLNYTLLSRMGYEGENIPDLLETLDLYKRNNMQCGASIVNLELGTMDFRLHKECCVAGLITEENTYIDALHTYLTGLSQSKPVVLSPNHEFSKVELLGLQQLLAQGDVDAVLHFTHETGRDHGERWRSTCRHCLAIEEKIPVA